MISAKVQRTLVKSPPELWAELSDPATLARHLGELGEIRIVCVAPESTVEWSAEAMSGTVSIKPSGWGTKVTLNVTREIAERAPTASASTEITSPAEPQPEAEVEAEPRPGFFARLFGRRRRKASLAKPTETLAEPIETLAEPTETLAVTPPPDLPPAPTEPAADVTADISAELMAAEEAAIEEVTAVLTAALDRLGAAHHRPFSRA